MKKTIIILGLSALTFSLGYGFCQWNFSPFRQIETWNKRMQEQELNIPVQAFEHEFQDGDLIFQTSLSAQSEAIQLATQSTYSHCGLIYKYGQGYLVFEAVQPVKRTPLGLWIARGQEGKYVVKRLKNAAQVLAPAALAKMKEIGDQFNGKNYDLAFEWSDDNIYCSELIWKIYQRATGIEIGQLEQLRDFDLTSKRVKAKLKARYGDNIPLDEIVISPAAIFDSDLLVTVKAN
ncbi:MAG: YiiX family permuted papain-like enzyme [Saprospiraceae bacterium]|nr:YiiX family permuted papain-like enzyme [Saprospiraceae bacterium]MDZ4705006.1 YiiX family permuted papain-like enzyme [Saprospiraceae bacterium]